MGLWEEMSFVYFLVCVALTFGPYFILYNTKLADKTSALKMCLIGTASYVGTQTLKLMLMATFVPSAPPVPEGQQVPFFWIQEVSQAIFGLFDVLGFYYAIRYSRGSERTKILGVGLGWSATESLVSRLLPLWMGARQTEFDWQWFFTGINANLMLALNLSLAAVIWLWGKRDLNRMGLGRKSFALLMLFPALAFVHRVVTLASPLSRWMALLVDVLAA